MLRRIPRPLALLLGVAALLSVAWAFTLAPFQGPDEPAHFNYSQHLAETGHRPSVTTGYHPDSTQVANALYYFNLNQLAGVSDARPAWSKVEERHFQQTLDALGPAAAKDGTGANPLAKNPPLYYAFEVVPYKIGSLFSFWDRLTLMRLSSGVLFLLTVAFTWLAASELFRATWPRVLATASVALLPQMTMMSGTVNADNLLIALWSAFTFTALRLVNRGPSARRILVACALAVASALTHGRGIAMLPALALVLVIVALRWRPSIAKAGRMLAPGVALLAVAAAAYRFLLTPDTGAYGGEVTISHGGAMSLKGFISNTWQFYFPRLPFMGPRIGPSYGYHQMFIEGFFGRFASLEVGYPAKVYALIQGVAAIGLAGLAAFLVGRWTAVRARWAQLAVLAAIAVSMLGLLHLASYRALATGPDPLITGRYLLPLVSVFGLAVAFVVSSLRPRWSALAGALVLGGLLALNLSGLMLTFTRFYA
ncbi:ArnT family glycosyltransferase [Solirubrobacter soli]|uniref:ArnT family glycosyltransferase n=1 Tax=Solirubrobacter soli TaxID=363832 RepID=UPI000426F9D1|nr:DUF2142 domain-containing protein [Solirubrobacter soli]